MAKCRTDLPQGTAYLVAVGLLALGLRTVHEASVRVAVTTWGAARGDFQPFLALAVALRRAGHDVVLGAPPDPRFTDAAAGAGIHFEPLGLAMEHFANEGVLGRARRARSSLELVRVGIECYLIPNLQHMYRDCLRLAGQADLVVTSWVQPAGRMAAESLGRPFVTATYDPSLIPTRSHPPASFPSLGSLSNGLLWRLIDAVANHYWGGGINEARRAVGLSPLPRRLISDGFFGPSLNLVEVSRHLVAPPPDWAPRHHVTGSWFLEEPDWDWSPPPELEEFLSAGPRPIAVYLGFGDTIEGNRAELLQILVSAIKESGVRAIVQTKADETNGCSGARSSVLYLASPVPHTWLLPRVTVMVHHGGAGVTHYTARAGIPSIIVPYVADQFYWGATMARLGVAPGPIPRSRLTAASLAQAIQVATADSGLRHRAAHLGALVRDEDGTANAVRLLEQLAGG